MIIRCKNTEGDGNVTYVEYEVADTPTETEEVEDIDTLKAQLAEIKEVYANDV